MIGSFLCSGKVINVDPSKKTYRVMLDRIGDKEATLLETGVDMSIPLKSRVGCAWSPSDGWKIMGVISTPYRRPLEDPDYSARADDGLAAEEAKLTSNVTEDDRQSLLTYRDPEDSDPANLQDEVSLNNKFARTFVRLFNDGSILAKSTRVLFWMFNKVKETLIVHCTKFLWRSQGLEIRHGVREDGRMVTSAGPTKPKVSTDINYSYDPDNPDDFDFAVDIGEIRKQGTTSGRGLVAVLRKLGVLDIDLVGNTIKFFSQSSSGREVMMSDNGLTLSWDQNVMTLDSNGFKMEDSTGSYFSLSNGTFAVKAQKVGLSSPVAIVPSGSDPSGGSTTMEAQGNGLHFKQSVYFGDAGEPAILKGMFDQHYKQAMDIIAQHAHQVTAVGSPTGPMLPPLATLNQGTLGNTAVTDLWFSLMETSF